MRVQRCLGTLPWQPFLVLMGYNFGCVIASGTIFDTWVWVFEVKLSDEDIAEIDCLRVVAMATNFGTQTAITSFM